MVRGNTAVAVRISLAFTASISVGQSFEQCGESDSRPPVTQADLRIAQRARQILNSPTVWNRADTRDCPAESKTFSLYCALEKATNEVSNDFKHRGAAMQEARFVIEDVSPRGKDYDHRLMDYNNDSTTTFADIQKFFDLLETRIASRLKEDPAQAKAEAARIAAACAATDVRIAESVQEILGSPSQWDRASTQDCSPSATSFGLYCAFEKATKEVSGENSFDGGGAGLAEARKLIDEIAPNHGKYRARLVDYNNDPTVTFEDLQRLLQLVEERLAKRLSDLKPSN